MAIIALKAWYIPKYEPIHQLERRSHDLRLSKSSLLKSALRADFLDDSDTVKQSDWFQRYLEGESVEFYIEGSGGYAISNIDLISHEIYFTKRDVMAHLKPTIFLCYQTDYAQSSDWMREVIQDWLPLFNQRSRLELTLEESHRSMDGPARINSALLRKIRQSLLFIADGTPILQRDGHLPRLIPSPEVCVELGYALQCKRSEQVLLLSMERSDGLGQFPFDIQPRSRLNFQSAKELAKTLPEAIEAQLSPFSLV
jgi:hypothetical protein